MEVVMDEEIRNAMELEIRRLNEEEEDIKNAMELEIRRLNEEEEVEENKLMEKREIRDMRLKFVLHTSPLEIIDPAAAVAVADDQKIELVIDVIDHYYIYQYWSPPLRGTSSILCQCQCQHHHDYHHPRDDDDEDMILTSCRPLCDPPRRVKINILLDQGVFAAAAAASSTTTGLLGNVDVLFSEYHILSTLERLEKVKASIALRISEAKAHVLREKPKRIRICVDVSRVVKNYYASAETATFVAAMAGAEEAACMMDRYRREVLPWMLLQGHNHV